MVANIFSVFYVLEFLHFTHYFDIEWKNSTAQAPALWGKHTHWPPTIMCSLFSYLGRCESCCLYKIRVFLLFFTFANAQYNWFSTKCVQIFICLLMSKWWLIQKLEPYTYISNSEGCSLLFWFLVSWLNETSWECQW